MLKKLLEISSIILLISLPLSFPAIEGLSQQSSRSDSGEITFISKEQTK
jgi:hypothetical protein